MFNMASIIRSLQRSIFLFSLSLLVACGTEDSDNADTKLPTIQLVANSDTAVTDEDNNVTTTDVRSNDTYISDLNALDSFFDANKALTIVAGDPQAINGIVVNNNDGTFTYTPDANFNGSDSFTYSISDTNGNSATGTVNITVNPVNDVPIATNDVITTNEDTPATTGDVTTNDLDVDGDALTATLVANASNGNVVDNNDGTFSYTPDANYNGSDSFTYSISDKNGSSATGTVNITVNPVNDVPIATSDVITTNEDTPATTGDVTTNDLDVDGDALTATLVANASNGNVVDNNDATFSYTPDANYNGSDSFTYTLSDGNGGIATGTVNITVIPVDDAPVAAAIATLAFDTKIFRFNWTDASDATYYKLMENPDGVSGFTQVGTDIPQGTQTVDHSVTLYERINASYILQSCNLVGCIDDTTIDVMSSLTSAIGYFKASNTGTEDNFGTAVSLSDDGKTLAVGALQEDSNTTGINSVANDSAIDSGAVYIFSNNMGTWSQQAYIKASNTGAGDNFGSTVSLSSNGDTLAVGAINESSDASGINGADNNNSLSSGAAYIYTRSNASWSQQAYIKASNTDAGDLFGISVSLSDDGNTLAVGAMREDSDTDGVNTTPNDNSQANDSGAAYIFIRSGTNWAQQAYLKASNTGRLDFFGVSTSLNADGNTLVVGAFGESSDASGIDGIDNNNAISSGAAYVFTRDAGNTWSQQAYLKASNTNAADLFGRSVNLNANGDTLAIGAIGEASNATGIDGADNNLASASGAVYVFTRDAGNIWSQQAYVKANNTESTDSFGTSVSLSADGDMLAIGAIREDSSSTGINTTPTDNSSADNTGAVYLFTRSGTSWSQLAYLKAGNTGLNDEFGQSVSLSDNGNTLAVGAHLEAGDSNGINGADNDNADKSGSVYLY